MTWERIKYEICSVLYFPFELLSFFLIWFSHTLHGLFLFFLYLSSNTRSKLFIGLLEFGFKVLFRLRFMVSIIQGWLEPDWFLDL